MRRIAIVGPPGSGKTTLADLLSDRLGLASIDLDALFHRPDWEPTPTPEFRLIVGAALEEADADHDGWAVAGNYLMVADLVQRAADTIVWLDLSRWRTMPRIIARSLGRVIRREQLWNGNRETWRSLLNPKRSMIVEAWRVHPVRRAKYEELSTTPLWAGAAVHRLRTPAAVDRFVDALD